MSNISRRDFLKGSVAAAAAVGAMGLGIASAEETPSINWDMETEVVVLGLGGAGASAAIEAYDAGAQVIVVEKQPENGEKVRVLQPVDVALGHREQLRVVLRPDPFHV